MEAFLKIFENKALGCAIVSWAVAQVMKIIIDAYRTKKLSLDLIVSSGGFPSSHTSFVVALAGAIGIVDGYDSTSFALATVLSCVVMYDAMGIRRAAGNHARILNDLIIHISENGTVEERLEELLGHTPLQVLGGFLLGVLVSSLMFI